MAEEKTSLHPRNKHRNRYDFPALINTLPELKAYVSVNRYGDESVNFSNPDAVKMLNRALLRHFYQIADWDIPANYLCPPIPGRADYIHYLADLLATVNGGKVPTGKQIKGLDIGVGANCVYPIIGNHEYGWSFVGAEVDQKAVKAAQGIIAVNKTLTEVVVCRQQHHKNQMFNGIIKPGELFDFTMCNPPFHASAEEARTGTQRKLQNLGKHKSKETVLNFGGQNAELWYEGGEVSFIRKMANESVAFARQCLWFSTLVSKSSNLSFVYKALERAGALEIKTVDMAQGQKISRFVAWTFLSPGEQQDWAIKRWATA